MPGPYTTFTVGTPAISSAKPDIVSGNILLVGPAQGSIPTPVPATGQLFPTGQAPQQGA
jgi:hypothetical protein